MKRFGQKEDLSSGKEVSTLKSMVQKEVRQRISQELLKLGTTLEIQMALKKASDSNMF